MLILIFTLPNLTTENRMNQLNNIFKLYREKYVFNASTFFSLITISELLLSLNGGKLFMQQCPLVEEGIRLWKLIKKKFFSIIQLMLFQKMVLCTYLRNKRRDFYRNLQKFIDSPIGPGFGLSALIKPAIQ